MRKLVGLLLIAVMAVGLFGCSKSNNELFTDEFFEGVVSIRNHGNEPVNDEQMKPVIEYLKNLKLEKTDECLTNIDENGNLLYGAFFLSFTMTDGTEIHLLHNDKKINGREGYAYILSDKNENLYAGLKEAFNKAHGEN